MILRDCFINHRAYKSKKLKLEIGKKRKPIFPLQESVRNDFQNIKGYPFQQYHLLANKKTVSFTDKVHNRLTKTKGNQMSKDQGHDKRTLVRITLIISVPTEFNRDVPFNVTDFS